MPFTFSEAKPSPVPGRHIRSPMGMHSISVGYKEASKIRSAVGAAFVKPQIQLELFRTYGAPAFDARLLTQGHRFAVTLGYGHVAPMVLGE